LGHEDLIAMDHSVKAMSPHRKVAFSRLLNRHRFENDELEALFQRYMFKVQHGSIASYVAIFIVLTAILATASFTMVQTPTVDNMYNSVHCLVFVIIFIFLVSQGDFNSDLLF
jgi:adenylate cyclase 1